MKTQFDDVMTEAEMATRYPDEYVAVEILEMDQNYSVTKGIVLSHGSSRNEVRAVLRKCKPKKFTILSFKKQPEKLAYLL